MNASSLSRDAGKLMGARVALLGSVIGFEIERFRYSANAVTACVSGRKR